MMRYWVIVVLGFVVVMGASSSWQPADAAQGWERLGTHIVDFGADRDQINVGANEGRFREIMFEADGGAIALYNVRVVFGNGQDYSPPTEFIFSDDERSRAINLPGARRIIRNVVFNYRSLRTGQGRATLTLYGR
jgi:hypothetical protein